MIKGNNQNECEHNEKSNRMGYYSPTGNDWALTGGGWINPTPDYSSYDLRSQQHLYPTDVADRRFYKIEIYRSVFKRVTSSKWCLTLISLLCCWKPKGLAAHVHVQMVSDAVCACMYLHVGRLRGGAACVFPVCTCHLCHFYGNGRLRQPQVYTFPLLLTLFNQACA